MADRATLRDALDDRRLVGSADDLPQRVSNLQPDDDLSYLVESDPALTVDQLRRLGSSEFQQLMCELYAALRPAVPAREPTPSGPRRQEPISRAAPAPVPIRPPPRPSEAIPSSPPLPSREPSSRVEPVDERPALPSLRVVPPPAVVDPDLEPVPLPDLELTIRASDLEEPTRRARLRPLALALALVAAAIVVLLPANALRAPTWLLEIGSGPASQSAVTPAPLATSRDAEGNSATTDPASARPPQQEGFSAPEPRSTMGGLLKPEEIETLLQQGDRFLLTRDIGAARSYYERAIAAGSGPAAFALARTFDPAFLAQIGAKGVRPDPERAAHWYRVAADSAIRRTDVASPAASAQPTNANRQP